MNADRQNPYDSAYAIEIIDDAMTPRVRRGYGAHVSPIMAPVPGDLVLIKIDSSDGVIGFVRNLVSMDERSVVTSMLNPERTDTFDRHKVVAVDRIFQVGVREYML